MRYTYRFAEGTLNGNYSELGVAATSTSQLFCRAIITPTAISVGPTDTLDVIYELRTYVPTVDTVTSITLAGAGTTHTVTVRPIGINLFFAPGFATDFILRSGGFKGYGESACSRLGLQTPTTNMPVDAVSNGLTITYPTAYVPGTYEFRMQFNLPLTQGNLAAGDFSLWQIATASGSWQVHFNPPIPKTASKKFHMIFRFALARA
jgi:hypothetical protein